MKPRYFLVGATASGKKALARSVAAELDAELLSLDSIKVYRGMDRGTDKSTTQAFGLTDLVEPGEAFSVGRFVRGARQAVAALDQAGRSAFFVGGTGLYLRALVKGLFEGPDIPEAVRQSVRQRLEEQGSRPLHRELAEYDPTLATRLHPNDAKRIVRGVEVYEATGRALSTWQAEHTRPGIEGPYHLAGLRWPTKRLRTRIDLRVARMFEQGLVEEVRRLRDTEALGPVARQAIGYREVLEMLDGKMDLEECRVQICNHTWNLARHQLNWFRQFPIRWVDAAELDEPARAQAILAALREEPAST